MNGKLAKILGRNKPMSERAHELLNVEDTLKRVDAPQEEHQTAAFESIATALELNAPTAQVTEPEVERVVATHEPASVVTPIVAAPSHAETKERLRTEVQQTLDRHTIDNMKVIDDPTSAIDQIVQHGNATIEMYVRSKELCTANYLSKIETINEARHTKTREIESAIQERRSFIDRAYQEIKELEEEIVNFQSSITRRHETFDEQVESITDNYRTNMGSYDTMIAAKRSEIKLLTSKNIDVSTESISAEEIIARTRVNVKAKRVEVAGVPPSEETETKVEPPVAAEQESGEDDEELGTAS